MKERVTSYETLPIPVADNVSALRGREIFNRGTLSAKNGIMHRSAECRGRGGHVSLVIRMIELFIRSFGGCLSKLGVGDNRLQRVNHRAVKATLDLPVEIRRALSLRLRSARVMRLLSNSILPQSFCVFPTIATRGIEKYRDGSSINRFHFSNHRSAISRESALDRSEFGIRNRRPPRRRRRLRASGDENRTRITGDSRGGGERT